MICQKCNKTVYMGVRDDEDEWQPVTKKRKPKPESILVDKMRNQFNDYWLEKYKINPEFYFHYEDYNYITASEPAILRNERLNLKMKSMGLPPNPVIVEPFAGTGADTITFLFNMHPAKIYTCDKHQAKSIELTDNVNNFKKACPDAASTDVINHIGEAATIFDKVKEDISLLYLDPPWKLGKDGHGPNGEADASQLVEYLVKDVFNHMRRKKKEAKLIVIKTRFDWQALSGVMEKLPMKTDKTPLYMQSSTTEFCPFSGTVYFHTLQMTTCVVLQWDHSQMFDTTYHHKHTNHKENGVLNYVKTVLGV
jgi:hypothetical protein